MEKTIKNEEKYINDKLKRFTIWTTNVDKKYDYRILINDKYNNDYNSNFDLNGSLLNLKNKYSYIKSIEGSVENRKFIITFSDSDILNKKYYNLILEINNLIRNYIVDQGIYDIETDCNCNNFLLFDYSLFSTFIEIRL